MRAFTRVLVCLLAVPLLLAVGCQRLDKKTNVSLVVGDIKTINVDPPRSEQQVSVAISSPVPVDVCIVTEGEQAAVQKTLEAGKRLDAAKVLASKERVENDTLPATVPAKTGFTIFLYGARKATEVKVNITGR
jgi:hypothetical protein